MTVRRPSGASQGSAPLEPRHTLTRVSDTHYGLSLPGPEGGETEVRLALESGSEAARRFGTRPVNCYAFACGRKANIPGGPRGPVSMPRQVTPATIDQALLLDGAIPLGVDPDSINPANLKIEEDQSYYLIAAMFHAEEYHFMRLFNDGWWAKPSKVGLVEQMAARVTIPTGKVAFKGTLCRPMAGGRSYQPVGYYLVPAPR